MKQHNHEINGIVTSPEVGKGNITEARAIKYIMKVFGIKIVGSFPNGTWVNIGKNVHRLKTMNESMIAKYLVTSGQQRESKTTYFLKQELRKVVIELLKDNPEATFFSSPQSMMIFEAIKVAIDLRKTGREIKIVMVCPDVEGKFIPRHDIDDRYHDVHYLVWNRKAYDRFKDEYNLKNVQLIRPVDPLLGYRQLDRKDIQHNKYLNGHLCILKASGSGADPKVFNQIIKSLNETGTRTIVAPGTWITDKLIVNDVDGIKVPSTLEEEVFYNLARNMENDHMLAASPSEQVKHLALLSSIDIKPRVVWLLARGQHEALSLAWAIENGFSNMVCVEKKYQKVLLEALEKFGISPNQVEFVEPDKLTAAHFKRSPKWKPSDDAIPLQQAILKAHL